MAEVSYNIHLIIEHTYLMLDYNRYQKSLQAATSPSFVEAEINKRLLEKLDFIRIDPQSILELGCGAGFGLSLLEQRFPNSHIQGLDINPKTLKHIAQTTSFKKENLTCADFNETLPTVNSARRQSLTISSVYGQ